MSRKYGVPPFLTGKMAQATYQRWLDRKARAHVKRDRKRGNGVATREAYMVAIHRAVVLSDGMDDYTGEALDWSLISRYNNEESKEGRRGYKASLALLPTVDHVGDGLGPADFKICAWRTNDAKNDLTHGEFVELCRRVIAHFEFGKHGTLQERIDDFKPRVVVAVEPG
jgi:hypothetical protein